MTQLERDFEGLPDFPPAERSWIELRRKDIYAVALHPGTTDTDLSVPFQQNVKPEKLFTPEYSTSSMLDVLDKLTPEDNGGFFAWNGSKIEF